MTPGTIVAGKYLVERTLAQGGMGVIVLCRHEALDQRVALKFLLPDAQKDEWVRARFLREAQAVARLESQHVARVYDVGTDPLVGPYYVMEYLEGCDLKELLESRGAQTVPDAVDYVLEAIDAIADAHALGVVHRDLKPANLFLAERKDGTRSVKVLDFGISKTLQPEVSHQATTASTVIGSPSYMPPEQLRESRNVDTRADVWALGVILYELTTANLPFEGSSLADLFVAILERPPIRPSAHTRTLPPGFEEIILRCLARDPNARFRDVAELATSLAPYGTGRAAACVERATKLLASKASRSPAMDATVRTSTDDRSEARTVPLAVEAKVGALAAHGQTKANWAQSAPGGARRRGSTVMLVALGIGVVALGAIVAWVRLSPTLSRSMAGRIPDAPMLLPGASASASTPASTALSPATTTPPSVTASASSAPAASSSMQPATARPRPRANGAAGADFLDKRH